LDAKELNLPVLTTVDLMNALYGAFFYGNIRCVYFVFQERDRSTVMNATSSQL